jgi:spermidine synthase
VADILVDAPAASSTSRANGTSPRTLLLLLLFFVSGFAALVYQVLWVRELGLLFGSTAQAAAMTIAIFFAGIAAGGWFWGRRAAGTTDSLRTFGLLEIGVAVTALGHFVLLDAYHAIYPTMHGLVGDAPVLDTTAKALVAATLLFPPALLMGGTLPLMGQHLVRAHDRLAVTGTTLYAVNTMGSATGALAAGFVLPLALGFRNAYVLAIALDLAVGVTAVALAGAVRRRPSTAHRPQPPVARGELPPTPTIAPGEPLWGAGPAASRSSERTEPAERTEPGEPGGARPPLGLPVRLVWLLAFASGLTTLAVEVVFTRLFAQVLQNSAYTYALVLCGFLLALALGAGAANLLARLRRPAPERVLAGLLLGGALATAIVPWLFHGVTDGLAYVGADQDWWGYVAAVAGTAAVTMVLPAVVLGALLPYLLRILQGADRPAGEALGRLVAANTFGAILGALAAGFVLLPTIGAWRSLLWLAAVYVVLLIVVLLQRVTPRRLGVAGVAALGAAALLLAVPQGLTQLRFGSGPGERVIEVREGVAATAAVVETYDDRLLRVNNFYTLGSTRGMDSERNQTVIPMLGHRDTRSVFYLGLGTGITAGAAMPFDLDRVVACEILPDVVELAERHFADWQHGLFDDPRVEIHAEDGRNCLRRSDETYDLIISDLFTPWKAGTGNLYTLEHYRTAARRLEPGGRYVQWLPLYQVSEQELGIVAATMDEAFDQVTLWRGDLFPNRSIVALVGEDAPRPLDPAVAVDTVRDLVGDPGLGDPELSDEQIEAMLLRLYAGNVTASGLFDDAELNTDDHPRIEYLAPRTHRAARTGAADFLLGEHRDELYGRLAEALPPDQDPYLVALDARQRDDVEAGRLRSRIAWLEDQGRDAQRLRDRYEQLSPPGSGDQLSPARLLLTGRAGP